MGVKLLSLPRVVFAQVLREMQLFEVFELSQVSKNMYTRIKRVRRKLKPITVSHGYSRSEISATESPGCNFDLNFRFEQRMDSVVIRKLNIRDLKIEVSEKIETRKTFLCFEDQFLTVMIPLLKHLMDLFNMKYTTLLVNYDRISEDFFHPTARTIPRILIEFAYSVCPVFVMNQEMITILHHDYEVESLNWLLKFWLSERNTKFQKLTLGCFWTPPNFNVLLKGVKYMEWDEKRRPRYYEYQETYFPIKIDCKDGFDLRRDDGVLATIAHDKERKMLHFIVWNQRQ
ncbi:Protein CBG20260 [Caenorhabditis briggsae]|uniref:Protein CBG20260 n=1 Tax=Caenorhabditis briggsae TaxID=6238 RepID=A8XXD9_CAEBR|nr:Protein CBG20260 [Caenorhabditis briggsae]CAP37328.2 Protein CBG20260 [Caenorhabditis briggsae]